MPRLTRKSSTRTPMEVEREKMSTRRWTMSSPASTCRYLPSLVPWQQHRVSSRPGHWSRLAVTVSQGTLCRNGRLLQTDRPSSQNPLPLPGTHKTFSCHHSSNSSSSLLFSTAPTRICTDSTNQQVRTVYNTAIFFHSPNKFTLVIIS